jgi:transposase IS116/IS110/IS902 family protein
MRHSGIGPLTSVTILAELGDARRFSSSREAVRYAGLDITVYQSDARRAPGHLSRRPAGDHRRRRDGQDPCPGRPCRLDRRDRPRAAGGGVRGGVHE